MKTAAFDLVLNKETIPIRYFDGDFKEIVSAISDICGEEKPRFLIVTDERVALLYGSELRDALSAAGFQVVIHRFPPGESEKNLYRVNELLDVMAAQNYSRSDWVIGFGGGVVTDLAGFAASIYQRGLNWIAIPTTLMGMVDAAIGGKTGVNHLLAKNMIGSFHQPRAIFANLETLKTLDAREMTAGSAEVAKAGLLAGGELWSAIQRNGTDLGAWPGKLRNEVIPKSAKVKIEIVSRDPKESGERRLLNLGHTFGHAFESATGYSTFLHGEAVFLGLRAAVKLSFITNRLSDEIAMEIDKLLSQVELPSAKLNPDELINRMSRDKKIDHKKLSWILLRSVGQPEITSDIGDSAIRETAEWICDIAENGTRQNNFNRHRRLLVLNGPNLNSLGSREPEIYGATTYQELCEKVQKYSREKNVETLIRQTNDEGELVNLIQSARHWADGVILNAGGYTHTSVAIRDAVSAISISVVEVHLSDITKREDFRSVSLIAPVCKTTIMGKGIAGYIEAIDFLLV